MPSLIRFFFFLTVFFILCETVKAENAVDTVSQSLNELVVTGRRSPSQVIPVQTLSGKELERLNSNTVADALRYFSGVQVKDYGGVGGIKTVNIRSMGTNHAGVVYDGVELGNAQNGQIDLGQFSLDNLEAISLYNGQKSEILQPAKDFGTAGSIYMRSRIPAFSPGENFHLKFTLRGGSFDLINPSALFEIRLSKTVNASLNAEWVHSSGRYKFRYRRVTPSGEVAYDTTAVRQNGDINAFRGELNLYGSLKNGSWSAKAYSFNSNRGIPGAIVNNVWRRGERLGDHNTFIQGNYSGFFGRFSTLNNLKYAYYYTHYVNNDDRQVHIDNRYHQNELYISSANQYDIFPWWKVSASFDFLFNEMTADLAGFSRPERFSNFISFATAFDIPRFKAQASLLGSFFTDRKKGRAENDRNSTVTPAIYLSGNPLRNTDFSLRAFFKQSYRMPTFNDLYYADIGNSELKPEKVTQYNVGALYLHTGKGLLNSVSLSADAYYNRVKDKIVAYPKGQQFRWTMLNLGLVDIRGVDIAGSMTLNPARDLYLTLRGQYTFQRAIDVTSPSDSFYRNQIPYIPRHSGSAVINARWRGWALNYSWIYVGERYSQQENIVYNYVQPWYTSDLSLSKDFIWRKVGFRALLEVNNLLNQYYDVIINYPMPGRNFRLTLSVNFSK